MGRDSAEGPLLMPCLGRAATCRGLLLAATSRHQTCKSCNPRYTWEFNARWWLTDTQILTRDISACQLQYKFHPTYFYNHSCSLTSSMPRYVGYSCTPLLTGAPQLSHKAESSITKKLGVGSRSNIVSELRRPLFSPLPLRSTKLNKNPPVHRIVF